MATDSIASWGEVFSVFLAAIAVLFCFYVYRQYRLRKSSIGWLALSFSLAIILVRRLLVLAAGTYGDIGSWMDSYEWLILVAISLLQLFAFWKIMGAYTEEQKVEFEAVDRLMRLTEKRAKGGGAKGGKPKK